MWKARAKKDARAAYARAQDEERERHKFLQTQQEAASSETDMITIQISSPPPSFVLSVHPLDTVLRVLELAAVKLGFDKARASLLQLEVMGAVYEHTTIVQDTPLSEASEEYRQCSVLGVEQINEPAVARRIDLVAAAQEVRAADVCFVCKWAPELVNSPNADGDTALHQAAITNSEEMAATLLDAKAEVDTRDSAGWTPLHEAAWYNSVAVARLLLSAGASVQSKNNIGYTPLHNAAQSDYLELANMLIEAGALEDYVEPC